MPKATNRRILRNNNPWKKSGRIETEYRRQLHQVAREIGRIVSIGDDLSLIQTHLESYAKLIEPWAIILAKKMIRQIDLQDASAWLKASKTLSRNLRKEIDTADVGDIMREFLAENVSLIKSLPLEAAEKVHQFTLEGITEGQRYQNIIEEVQSLGDITRTRATLIARTETARTASYLTAARAVHIGSDGYTWRTAADSDVRKLHKELEGKFYHWDDPPITGSQGERSLPGAIYN